MISCDLALISDLHGNELAFDAVLADARGAFDQLVCLGDVATLGPRPGAVLARLRDLGCPCILGNHDEFMLNAALVRSYSESPLVVASVDATRQALSPEELAFIGGFSRTLALGDVFLYHGTPRSNMEDLLADTPVARVDEMLGGRQALVFAGGHTHLQMVRQHRGMLLVNPGSLGLPFREYAAGGPPVVLPHAEYAVVDVRAEGERVEVRRVALERRALVSQLDGWDNPLAAPLRAAYA
ncbi:MAG TPA: metallophosphoesterase family protein [Polyangiaceae bacterium]|nr:metallophosphoesterase family protein [Polyangiaceae bacterium]